MPHLLTLHARVHDLRGVFEEHKPKLREAFRMPSAAIPSLRLFDYEQ